MRVRAALLLATLLIAAGCYDDPVDERLVLRVHHGGLVEASVELRLAPPGGSPLMNGRLAELRLAYDRGADAWSRRFERLRWAREERTLVRERRDDFEGVIEVRHSALAPPAEIPLLFADVPVTASVVEGEHWVELTLVPGTAGAATAEQRLLFSRSLDAWSGALAAYLAEADALYRDLETDPERARALFVHLFADLLPDDAAKEFPLTEEESERVTRTHDAMARVADLATADRDVSHTLNELSLLVFDPFPARVSLCLPGPPLEVEGFIEGQADCWEVPRAGILDVLEKGNFPWIEPDPLTTWLAVHRSRGQETLDLDRFVSLARTRGSVPTAAAVRRAVERQLRHEGAYRIRWPRAGE